MYKNLTIYIYKNRNTYLNIYSIIYIYKKYTYKNIEYNTYMHKNIY